ncbi:MAG: hypothetical protein IJN07_00965 [Clostridia bacterium]|nr:hypothetical protein [Clostridia bacterium]
MGKKMFFKIASIREATKLKKKSIALCIVQMLVGLFVIPYVVCMLTLVLCSGEVSNVWTVTQYVIYFFLVALYWYACNIRKWSHSYMLDYTKRTLENQGAYCPRCFSRMKTSLESFDYEEKIGEETIKTVYSDGYVSYDAKVIMEKRKEKLPHFVCTGKKCALETKPQKSSADSYKVRWQVKNNYSFFELPRGMRNTYRLILGDTNSACKSSMMRKFHTGLHRALIGIIFVVLLIVSKINNYGVTGKSFELLWGTTDAIITFAVMTTILVIAYVIAEIIIKRKSDKICSSEVFAQDKQKRHKQLAETYFAKCNGEYVIQYRKKAIRKARKEKDPMVEKLPKYDYQGERKLLKDKQHYVDNLLKMLACFLNETELKHSTNFLNGTYIVEALTKHLVPKKYSFIVDEGTGYLAMSTYLRYGLYEEHIENIVTDWLKENENHTFPIFVDRDPCGVYVSAGIPFTLDYQLKDSDKNEFENTIGRYMKWIATLQDIIADEFGEEEDFSETPDISKQLLEQAANQLKQKN